MADAVKAIEDNRQITINLLELPLDDKPTYELLSRGDSQGVFQFDSSGYRPAARDEAGQLRGHLALGALYRPVRWASTATPTTPAQERTAGDHADPPGAGRALKEILEPTYGLIVYQEQVQAAAQILAGYTWTSGPAPPRHGQEEEGDPGQGVRPVPAGLPERGYSDKAIQAVWDVLVPFAGYAFNKAHSPRTAWSPTGPRPEGELSAEYMARCSPPSATTGQVGAVPERVPPDGIKVLPPDVNESVATFAAVGKDVRFGLAAIRNVGVNVWRQSSPPASPRAVHQLRRLPAQGPLVVCNSG